MIWDAAVAPLGQKNAREKLGCVQHTSFCIKGKMEAQRRQELVAQGKELKDRLAKLEVEVDALEAELQAEGQKLPNMTHPDVRHFL